ncbi:dTDP-4-amino-4,6-dideoxygalactose transaminase [Vreelandella songnenensis]|uniref:dTDP-4-amino-4,6-dideoxygalactose transaminase n=1 Tax=Vreelandella songnenensis TaxID=1176243 RepID=A0A2T0V2G7_9GAMM|nr:DegT/DnrJ/EryC1/StrS family aminotransferase [Halomonas songnenensis]PRY64258.1 dTDP-4-amino-4,6-dideoxygalactose transaminase [Halomonas songnenensis]
MIPVAKPYLPSREKLNSYIDGIYDRAWLTNNGQLVQELTRRLEEYLEVENLLLVANGTLALQIAYRALGISGTSNKTEAITTPFTFVATASSLKWEGIDPVFSDIDETTWCLDPSLIEQEITSRTKAIVPVHVFGNACDIEAIDFIAQRHDLKVVYDASHAFGVKYRGKSILRYGDAATLSFHATKLFHTGEGGAIIFKRKEDLERAKKMINFGITGPETIEELGINAKLSELHAAIGLSVLDEIDNNIYARNKVADFYRQQLSNHYQHQVWNNYATQNNAYIPLVLNTEESTIKLVKYFQAMKITVRRYFYPSLSNIPLVLKNNKKTTISDGIASRIVCLPIYSNLPECTLHEIVKHLLLFDEKE